LPRIAAARIIRPVARRIHVKTLRAAEMIPVDPAQAHHARDVLRLADGARVEVFDDAGAVGTGVLVYDGSRGAAVRVESIDPGGAPAAGRFLWTVASAVPKGERADWMVEKLSELGAAAFVPLAAARSVVLPEGRNKRERWLRIATESAKQSRRVGVMRVGELLTTERAAKELVIDAGPGSAGWYFSTADGALPVVDAAAAAAGNVTDLALFIGPEGGWTDQEMTTLDAAGLTAVRLTSTVLRVETAAVAAGAVVACVLGMRRRSSQPQSSS
jgi:16S rRNA (uracil1498-N3)-methyltransferase